MKIWLIKLIYYTPRDTIDYINMLSEDRVVSGGGNRI